MAKTKALIAAEAKVEELESLVEDLRGDIQGYLLNDWNNCGCTTCRTIRKHQHDTVTIDELLVLAAK